MFLGDWVEAAKKDITLESETLGSDDGPTMQHAGVDQVAQQPAASVRETPWSLWEQLLSPQQSPKGAQIPGQGRSHVTLSTFCITWESSE